MCLKHARVFSLSTNFNANEVNCLQLRLTQCTQSEDLTFKLLLHNQNLHTVLAQLRSNVIMGVVRSKPSSSHPTLWDSAWSMWRRDSLRRRDLWSTVPLQSVWPGIHWRDQEDLKDPIGWAQTSSTTRTWQEWNRGTCIEVQSLHWLGRCQSWAGDHQLLEKENCRSHPH